MSFWYAQLGTKSPSGPVMHNSGRPQLLREKMPPRKQYGPRRYAARYNPVYRRKSRKGAARRLQAPKTERKVLMLSRGVRNPIPSRAIVKFCLNLDFLMAAGGTTGTILYPINMLYRPMASATLTNVSIATGYASTDTPNTFLNYVGGGALFKKARVISHGIKISCSGQAFSGGTMKVCCAPSPDTVGFGSYYTCGQASNSKRLQPSGICSVYQPETLKGSWTMASVAGISPRAIMDEDDYCMQAPTTAPVNVMSNTIQIESPNQVATTGAVYLNCDFFWTVQLESPNVVGSSD